eukprot:TRINITY_DN29742_c0_g1_i1.p1 TRINITY_DN29742_c0_g1~~TRINITY_DN29742_c0_g1_i1.p1  ORF type:complete len:250 (-),score=22.59 TRINITY_DN29742_c0_g1_i1:6-755(-)
MGASASASLTEDERTAILQSGANYPSVPPAPPQTTTVVVKEKPAEPESDTARKPAPKLHTIAGKHTVSDGTVQLLQEIGGGDVVRQFCTRFYEHAYRDTVLQKFQFMTDGIPAHGKRLGDWIVEKMGGEGQPWTTTRPADSRQRSHHSAWNNPKREPEKRGWHFKLDDCVIWMRLNFWAVREQGLANTRFWDWYIMFIGHFIGVYERRAPRYAPVSAEWSANQDNLDQYMKAAYTMKDVAGWSHPQAGQ